MHIERFLTKPEQALEVRITVFVKEQGFRDQFDEIDERAAHFVAFDEENNTIGTCRVFASEDENIYLLGRLAVIKEYRGQNIGSQIVAQAEKHVHEVGGKELRLHSQYQVVNFYEKLGYTCFGDIEEEEGHPHIWMKKEV